MNYNNLMFYLILIIGLGVTPSNAQTIHPKEIIVETEMPELVRFEVKAIEAPILVNRHRDLINAMVKSKIECAIDLFKIENERLLC